MKTCHIMSYFDRLFPICRSITGNGLRESFHILQEIIPLKLTEIPSGTRCFDWLIPDEWNIKAAYIQAPDGKKIINFSDNNLHVVNYSVPVNKTISHGELMSRVHSLPDMPEAIPYRTSYYNDNWGFCVSENQRKKLIYDNYQVVIDSDKRPGALTFGDVVLPGDLSHEVLISTYLCHPSMANNELSGPLVTAFLYKKIASLKNRKFTYRFVFVPETIGAIAYLSLNGDAIKGKTIGGLVVTCCGDRGDFTYKRSRQGNSLIDNIVERTLKSSGVRHKTIDFFPSGSDERQYSSPGFDLPVGSLMRSMYGEYKEYHTSLDNREFVTEECLQETVDLYFSVIQELENSSIYVSTNPYCEPQLGKRGLYSPIGGLAPNDDLKVKQYLLNYSDGKHDLKMIANKANLPETLFFSVAEQFVEAGLLIKLK